MKNYFFIAFTFIVCLFYTTNVSAQNRIKVKEGLYLVTYGSSTVIEDEINQRTISLEVRQEGIDQKTNKKIYNVVCGKWSKRVVKDGLKLAIAAGIKAAGATEGSSLIISAAATLANYIYDDMCESLNNY